MKIFIFLLIFVPLISLSYSQQILLDRDVEEQYDDSHGPNMRHYTHFYGGYGLILPVNENKGAKINFGRSPDFLFGYRYKLKLLSFYAIGTDISFRYQKYNIKDEGIPPVEGSPLAMATDADKFSIGLSSLGLEAYNRINIGKRGNSLGNYFDIGIKGEWNYGKREIIRDRLKNPETAERIRMVRKGLKYVEDLSTIMSVRLGHNKVCLYGNYRISDLFRKSYDIAELPVLSAGLQYTL